MPSHASIPSTPSLRGSKAPCPAVMISLRERYGPPLSVPTASSSSPFWLTRSRRLHLLAQAHLGAVLEALLGAELDEPRAEDLRMAGDVVDVLLGVDRRDLAAELLQALDDPDGRVPVAGVVRGREPDGARSEDGDVDDAVLAHGAMLARVGGPAGLPGEPAAKPRITNATSGWRTPIAGMLPAGCKPDLTAISSGSPVTSSTRLRGKRPMMASAKATIAA